MNPRFAFILVALLIPALMVPSVYAGVTFTSVTYDDSTADVGTTRTISVAMRSSSSSESVTATDITMSGGLTTASAPQTPFTITYTPVTKTFTVRSDTASTYSFAVTVVDSSGNSYSSSTDLGYSTLEYVNPDSLSLTSIESPSGSYDRASSTTNKFGVVVRLQNSLTSTQTRNLTLYFDSSGFTVSGDPQTALVSLAPGQTEKIWNVTVSSASTGAHNAYVRLGDNTAAATYSFTVTDSSATTTTSVSGSSSSSGGDTTTIGTTTTSVPPTSETKTIASIAAGANGSITIDKENTLKIQSITVKVNTLTNGIIITTKESVKPANVSDPVSGGKTYKYIEIIKSGLPDANIDEVSIAFKVEKSWLTSNNVNQASVALYRYTTSGWQKFDTTKTNDDANYVYYLAKGSSLSIFAIAGSLGATTTTVAANATTTTAAPGFSLPKFEFPESIGGIPTTYIIGIIVIIIIVAVLIFVFFKDKLGFLQRDNWKELYHKFERH